ncbi:hypothetical protein H4R35_002571 [Dimargaris xerosporica]|nr:hypothetical protein H4R35_002571 [Dimargaris xerosporica]
MHGTSTNAFGAASSAYPMDSFIVQFKKATHLHTDGRSLSRLLLTGDEWRYDKLQIQSPLLTRPNRHHWALYQAAAQSTTDFGTLCTKQLGDSPLAKVAAAYLDFVATVARPEAASDLFGRILEVIQQFSACYKSTADGWWLAPTLAKWVRYMVAQAYTLDWSQGGRRSKFTCTNQAIQPVSRLFNTSVTDRAPLPQSKQRTTYILATQAFRIYFRLRKTRLCQSIINHIHNINRITNNEFTLDRYPIGQQVTYRYYVGRYWMYQHQMVEAEEQLALALAKCTARPSAFANRKKIITNLLVARMILGQMPRSDLLHKYRFHPAFHGLMAAFRQGHITRFQGLCDELMDVLLPSGNYWLLRERCLILLYRNLFYHV